LFFKILADLTEASLIKSKFKKKTKNIQAFSISVQDKDTRDKKVVHWERENNSWATSRFGSHSTCYQKYSSLLR